MKLRIPNLLALLAAAGLLLPPAVRAESPSEAVRPSVPPPRDVALQGPGTLQLQVVSRSGQPIPGLPVWLHADASEAAGRMALSDGLGRVAYDGVLGGAYLIRCGNQLQPVRVWTAQAAPPIAVSQLLVVQEDEVLRAQQPFCNLLGQEPIMIAVLVAAAIAIPIAVHNSGSDAPSGS